MKYNQQPYYTGLIDELFLPIRMSSDGNLMDFRRGELWLWGFSCRTAAEVAHARMWIYSGNALLVIHCVAFPFIDTIFGV
jgi:hypothetical protein